MVVLQIAIVIFIVMELSNVLILYFKPQFRYGNSMRSFRGYKEGMQEPTTHLFVTYMVRWVANCKLIFIAMLAVVAIYGDLLLMRWAVGATVCSIGVYFVSLHPILKRLDQLDCIEPKGYSKRLSMMILGFMLLFMVALLLSYLS